MQLAPAGGGVADRAAADMSAGFAILRALLRLHLGFICCFAWVLFRFFHLGFHLFLWRLHFL